MALMCSYLSPLGSHCCASQQLPQKKAPPIRCEAGWLPEMIPACCSWFLAGVSHDSHAIHSLKGVAAPVLALHHCAIANVDWFPAAADMSPLGVARTGLHQLLSRSLCPCGYLRAALSDHLLSRLRILYLRLGGG